MDKEDLLFGHYLNRFSDKKINLRVIEEALSIQKEEDNNGLKHRMIGTILFEDFNVFEDVNDLVRVLEEYHTFKSEYMK